MGAPSFEEEQPQQQMIQHQGDLPSRRNRWKKYHEETRQEPSIKIIQFFKDFSYVDWVLTAIFIIGVITFLLVIFQKPIRALLKFWGSLLNRPGAT